MNDKKRLLLELAVPLSVVVGIPIMIGVLLLAAEGPPMQALAVMAGVYAMGLTWTALGVVNGIEERKRLGWRVRPAWSELVLLAPSVGLAAMQSTSSVPNGPTTLLVLDATGKCPRGFKVNDTWQFDAAGRLSHPLCTAAMQAIEPVLAAIHQNGNGRTERVACICPVPGRKLTFAVARASATPRPLALDSSA